MAQRRLTAQEVIAATQAIVNDVSGQHYNEQRVLPYLKLAYRKFSQKLIRNQVQYVKEAEAISTLAAGSQEISVPSDLIVPVTLDQRESSSDPWRPLRKHTRIQPPDAVDLSDDITWTWREGSIVLSRPIPEAREFFLRYRRSLMPLENAFSTIEVPSAELHLALATAALILEFVQHDPVAAAAARTEAEEALNDIIGIETNVKQSRPVRRRTVGYQRIDSGFAFQINPAQFRR